MSRVSGMAGRLALRFGGGPVTWPPCGEGLPLLAQGWDGACSPLRAVQPLAETLGWTQADPGSRNMGTRYGVESPHSFGDWISQRRSENTGET